MYQVPETVNNSPGIGKLRSFVLYFIDKIFVV